MVCFFHIIHRQWMSTSSIQKNDILSYDPLLGDNTTSAMGEAEIFKQYSSPLCK